MKRASILLLIGVLFALGSLENRGATTPVSDDLWDISNGVVVTTLTPVYPEASSGIFGGTGYNGPGEGGNTLLNDAAAGFVNLIQWRTAAPVSVQTFRLFARGDLGTDYRDFNQFTVKCKTGGSSTYNTTLFSFTPNHPYTFLDPVSYLVFQTNLSIAITAQDFQAEVIGRNAGARVIELDAFGVPPPPSILTPPIAVSIYPGRSAEFTVAAGGESLFFQWQHEETNLVEDARITGVNGPILRIQNATSADAGNYSVMITNQFGSVQTTNVALTILTDTNVPVITLTGPTNTTLYQQATNFVGTVSDQDGIKELRWELNGVPLGTNESNLSTFSIPIQLEPGTNLIKFFAKDFAGNEGVLEVTRVCVPITQSLNDLWDLSQGTIVITNSGMYPQQSVGILGGTGMSSEPGRSVFSDNRPNGFTHFLEWRTKTPVVVAQARLFAFGDAFGEYRSFSRFTVLTKSEGSTNFDTTVFSFTPNPVPPPVLAPETYLVLVTNFTAVTGQVFRAEIVQNNGGPRIVELDAFGLDANSPPEISVQPSDKEGYEGGKANFTVGVTGANTFAYQWRREGTNLVDSSKYQGTSSATLTVNDLNGSDAGSYSVVVKNHLGTVISSNAFLTIGIDTNAPLITIVSPTAGTNTEQSFVLNGTITDNDAVEFARWERNGNPMGALSLTNGEFNVGGLKFVSGENQIRIIAGDRVGHETTNELSVTWIPARALIVEAQAPLQEGGILTVPISLVSTGGVSGADFRVQFDTNYLTEPQFIWIDQDQLGLTSLNLESNRVFRASFAVGGPTLVSGTRTLANMVFRTRSVRTNTIINFTPTLMGIYADTGNPFTNGNYVQGTTALITKRKIVGDNNANDRLDVGDASIILRLANGIDPLRAWDIAANDLNNTLAIDSGDVIKVLRVVVGIDPQPQVPQNIRAFSSVSLEPPLAIIADKEMASAGEKVTLSLMLTNQTKSLTGISFRMEYPTNALRLENATAHQLGPIVPAGAFTAWNISPNQTDYVAQNGALSLGVSAANSWPLSNGVVARLTFTVQSGATSRFGWPVTLKNVELSRPNFQIQSLSSSEWTFISRDPLPSEFGSEITFSPTGVPTLTFQGDLGATYVIEASSDLHTWEFLGTYYNATGSFSIEDAAGAGADARFYRATLQQ
jgi:hypothetical protein